MLIALAISAALASDADEATFLLWAKRQVPPDPHPAVADGYAFASELFPRIAAAVREKPGVVDVELLDHTPAGRPIWAFHVEDPGTPVTRSVLVFANIHALEWISSEVAVDVLLWEIEHPAPGVRVTVIPVLNPDGRAKVEDDLVAGRDEYRRGNGKNVDLNRDFPVNSEPRAVWRHVIPEYYLHSDVPLELVESRALDALAAREVYDRAVSLHAFGGFLFYPWAGRFAVPPDNTDFVELGRAMEQAQGPHAYHTQQLGRWGFFFRAQGAEIDDLYGRYGTRAFLIELTRSGLTLNPKTWHSYFRWYNPKDPARHVESGLRAVRALIDQPETRGERASPAGTPREPRDP